MKVERLSIPGLLLITPRVFGDSRGFFVETYQRARYAAAGLEAEFVQDNLSRSDAGVLRGLHLQHPRAQGKLVSVLKGRVFDVAVDLRPGSPTFGRHEAVELDGESKRQFWIPPGFAHGFLTLEDDTWFHYKCTEVYSPGDELTLAYDDPEVGVAWPAGAETVSEKDRAGLPWAAVAARVAG